MPGPFSGLKVIEVGSFVAAPAAATILSDFGADVVKIETPGVGDPWRHQVKRPELPLSDHNYLWLLTGRNKRSVEIDLKHEAGQDLLRRLVMRSDIFLTNMPLTTRSRLGIEYAQIEKINERIIYASMTGYGEAGADKNDAAFDTTAYWGRSGLMYMMQPDLEAAPWRPPTAAGDHVAALAMFGAIATALYRRAITGRGANVGASLLATGAWVNACYIQAGLCDSEYVPVPTRQENLNPLNSHYRCSGGGWVNLSMNAQQQELHYVGFAAAIGRPNLASDTRFATLAGRRANADDLVAALDEAFAHRTAAEWKEHLTGRGYVIDVMAHPFEAARSEQMKAAGAVVPLAGADGVGETVSSPFWIENDPKATAQRAPELGGDTFDVLTELGLDAQTIENLRRNGCIGLG